MQTEYGHLTYCSNIHPGESWEDHFAQLQEHLPAVKKAVSPGAPFGVGLRLSDRASRTLEDAAQLDTFRNWLKEEDLYVFTLNGFPYGGFHRTRVKDGVHEPDWRTEERVAYTIRLARILAGLLPEGLEGGISTSPLSYRHWHSDGDLPAVLRNTTGNVVRVAEALLALKRETGRTIHLDLEPEPDGLLSDGPDFFRWYTGYLLPLGKDYLQQEAGLSAEEAESALKTHVQLCYDVCHFAVNYEDPSSVLRELKRNDIRVGKIQISAALKAALPSGREARQKVLDAFRPFNESTYLHQVIVRQENGERKLYADLPDALADPANESAAEWRAHFHVPLFIPQYGLLRSTRSDIEEVVRLHRAAPFSAHLEIETYTWEVLPPEAKLPLTESIIRELHWVTALLGR